MKTSTKTTRSQRGLAGIRLSSSRHTGSHLRELLGRYSHCCSRLCSLGGVHSLQQLSHLRRVRLASRPEDKTRQDGRSSRTLSVSTSQFHTLTLAELRVNHVYLASFSLLGVCVGKPGGPHTYVTPRMNPLVSMSTLLLNVGIERTHPIMEPRAPIPPAGAGAAAGGADSSTGSFMSAIKSPWFS